MFSIHFNIKFSKRTNKLKTHLFWPSQDIIEETIEAFRQISHECRIESNVSDDELKMIKMGDWSSDEVTAKEYFRCLMKRTLLDTDGKLREDLTISTDRLSETLRKCVNRVGEVTLETSWDFAQCYIPDVPEHLIIETWLLFKRLRKFHNLYYQNSAGLNIIRYWCMIVV